MKYYVYRITCFHPNSKEKYYYGFRKSVDPINDNYWSSSKYVKDAISNYGISYFKKKILKIFDNRIEAAKYESFLHEKFNVDKNEKFFNKCKSTIWGYNCTGDILAGKTYEEIHGLEKAASLKSARSQRIKQTISEGKFKGSNNPNYGNKWTEDMKNKMSEIHCGENHPQYGYIWINNLVEEKKIKPNSEIPNGWFPGRLKQDNTQIREEFLSSALSRKEFAKLKGIRYNTIKGYLKGLKPFRLNCERSDLQQS
jgi:hypothetical protein